MPIRQGDVEGGVYYVRDAAWGFEAAGRDDHPGVCLWFPEDARYATFVKGSDAARVVRHHCGVYVLEPDGANGLIKPTALQLVPRVLPRRLVLLMHDSPRLVGRVNPQQLADLRQTLARAVPRGGGTGR